MKKVAITGGIATGKSLILQKLMFMHYVVYSADAIAHDVLRNEGKQDVINSFGSFILNENNEIDRKVLGKIVFNDLEKLTRLNNIIHPYVQKRIKKIIEQKSFFIISLPIIFKNT